MSEACLKNEISVYEILEKNTKIAETVSGNFRIRKVTGLDFFNFLGFLPSGDKIDLPSFSDDKKVSEAIAKAAKDHPEMFIRAILTNEPVSPQLTLEGEDDPENNIVSAATIGDVAVLQLFQAIKEFSGFDVSLGAGQAKKKTKRQSVEGPSSTG